jgi:hypothetical protein
MITYVHMRLIQWGDWVVRGRNVGRNGFPSQSAFARWMPSAGASAWSPLLDVEAEEVDQCVLRLEGPRRELVRRYYTRSITSAMLARELGCCEKTLYNRMTIAHNEILGMLNDLAAGIELPKIVVSMDPAAPGADRTVETKFRASNKEVVDVRYSDI